MSVHPLRRLTGVISNHLPPEFRKEVFDLLVSGGEGGEGGEGEALRWCLCRLLQGSRSGF